MKKQPISQKELKELLDKNLSEVLLDLNTKLKTAGITPLFLARKANLSKDTILRFLERKTKQRKGTLFAIARALLELGILESDDEVIDCLFHLELTLEEAIQVFSTRVLDIPPNQDADKYLREESECFLEKKKWGQRYPKGKVPKPYYPRVDGANEEIISLLNANSYLPSCKVLICYGAHGVGKTALLHYLSETELKDQYRDGVFWLNSQISSIEEGLSEIEKQMLYKKNEKLFRPSWMEWISDPGRRVLFVLDDVQEDIAKWILSLGGKKLQYIFLTSELVKFQRVALNNFETREIVSFQIKHLTGEDFSMWSYIITQTQTLPSSVVKFLKRQDIQEEIFQWCEKLSFLPEGMKSVFRSFIDIGYGYEDVEILEHTMGLQELASLLLKDLTRLQVKQSILLLEREARYTWFNLDDAANYLVLHPDDAKQELNGWASKGLIEKSRLSSAKAIQQYRVLRIIHESCNLARRNQIDPLIFLRPDLA